MPKIFFKMAEERREEPREIAEGRRRYEEAKKQDKESISSLSPDDRGYESTGKYVYTTDKAVESFGDVPYKPPVRAKNDLSPPSSYIEPTTSVNDEKNRELESLCKRNPLAPQCGKFTQGASPKSAVAHEESNIYQELGIFSEEVKDIFDPQKRSRVIEKKRLKRPVQNLYIQTRDDQQLTKSPVVRTECKCKDGRTVLGWMDTRNGVKDCSNCSSKKRFSSPSIYKNYKTRKTKRWQDKPSVPLRKQVGVSSFGDVDMKGCQTGNQTRARINNINANKTINNVISTKQSEGQRVTTDSSPISPYEGFSIYDRSSTNIYGI